LMLFATFVQKLPPPVALTVDAVTPPALATVVAVDAPVAVADLDELLHPYSDAATAKASTARLNLWVLGFMASPASKRTAILRVRKGRTLA